MRSKLIETKCECAGTHRVYVNGTYSGQVHKESYNRWFFRPKFTNKKLHTAHTMKAVLGKLKNLSRPSTIGEKINRG